MTLGLSSYLIVSLPTVAHTPFVKLVFHHIREEDTSESEPRIRHILSKRRCGMKTSMVTIGTQETWAKMELCFGKVWLLVASRERCGKKSLLDVVDVVVL
jgi:hypothetical protein